MKFRMSKCSMNHRLAIQISEQTSNSRMNAGLFVFSDQLKTHINGNDGHKVKSVQELSATSTQKVVYIAEEDKPMDEILVATLMRTAQQFFKVSKAANGKAHYDSALGIRYLESEVRKKGLRIKESVTTLFCSFVPVGHQSETFERFENTRIDFPIELKAFAIHSK